jgi:hypothetical protein
MKIEVCFALFFSQFTPCFFFFGFLQRLEICGNFTYLVRISGDPNDAWTRDFPNANQDFGLNICNTFPVLLQSLVCGARGGGGGWRNVLFQ